MGNGAEVVIRRQNKCINFFKKNNANSLENALDESYVMSISSLSKRTIRNLIKEGVIISTNNKMYLDEQQAKIFKKSLKRFFLI